LIDPYESIGPYFDFLAKTNSVFLRLSQWSRRKKDFTVFKDDDPPILIVIREIIERVVFSCGVKKLITPLRLCCDDAVIELKGMRKIPN